jgi:release factor glutamine methyltransferase
VGTDRRDENDPSGAHVLSEAPETVPTSVGVLLDGVARFLAGPNDPPARADARDLIAAILDRPRFWPTANRDRVLEDDLADRIVSAAEQLKTGMPMQYAVGRAAFRYLTLSVDRRVLIPRPETELLVEIALALAGGGGTVADICTGSGAVALALASEGQFDRVIATDISSDALEVARANLAAIAEDRRGVVEFRQGDLLAPILGERVRAVVSNPPYISPSELADLPADVRDWEPHLALFSADDGMAAIRAIVRDAPAVLEPGGILVMEIDARRAGLARDAAATDSRYCDVELRLDLTGRERFLVARHKE